MQVQKCWIIKEKGGRFIGIDSNSGGYFYLTGFWDCKKFASLKSALDYASVDWGGNLKNNEWQIFEVDEVVTKISSQQNSYYDELAALKKKYNMD